jgi:Ca2+-binding EF-hand superfamily protein
MRLLLEAIGENPTEEELLRFMADVDEGGKGEIEFAEFLRAFEKQRSGNLSMDDEKDIVHAFAALGGSPDKAGYIDNPRMISIVKEKLGLNFKIEKLLEELDVDKDGKVSFVEFRNLFL